MHSKLAYRFHIDKVLLSLVQQHPHVYDKDDLLFKDHAARQSSWEAISKAMNMSVNKVLKRYSLLRRRYCTEKKKGLLHASTWPLMESMEFLDKFIVPREKKTCPDLEDSSRSSFDEGENNALEFVSVNITEDAISTPLSDNSHTEEHHFVTAMKKRLSSVIGSDNSIVISADTTVGEAIRNIEKSVGESVRNSDKNIGAAVSSSEKIVCEMIKSTEESVGEAVRSALLNIKSKKKRALAQAEIFKVLASYVDDD